MQSNRTLGLLEEPSPLMTTPDEGQTLAHSLIISTSRRSFFYLEPNLYRKRPLSVVECLFVRRTVQ